MTSTQQRAELHRQIWQIANVTPAVNPVYINLGDFDYAA